jgi:putative endonuclease
MRQLRHDNRVQLNHFRNVQLCCHFEEAKRLRNLMTHRLYFVYLMTNWNNTVMYVGMTNDLPRRVYEHKNKLLKGFTSTYNINKLVYYESTTDVHSAIDREKEIKKWRRDKKNKLVIMNNPDWIDLSIKNQDFSPAEADSK